MPDKPYDKYNEGDTYEGEIINSIFSSTERYLIFEGNNSGTVTVATNDPDLRANCSKISSKISLITGYLVTKAEMRKFVDRIGLAYSEAIESNFEIANEICDTMIKDIILLKKNKGRFSYLATCLMFVIFFVILSYLQSKFSIEPLFDPYLTIMVFSAIGGFFSVALNINKIEIDIDDFSLFHFFNGGLRILISILAGVIIYVLIKSELIIPSLINEQNNHVFYLLAVLAGFSESYIPNLLKKIELNDKTINF